MKALAYNKVLVGREAVAADLGDTFRQHRLEFVENRVDAHRFFSKAAPWSST